jgi:Caspase domain
MDDSRSALIVASDDYADPGLRRLRAPASDAQALAAVLRDPAIGGFEVRTLLNQPAHEISLAVEEFFADRRPDDLLLLHFSCHGVKDEDGELYLAASNSMLRRLGATAVAAEFVNRRMSRSRSRRVVLLLDCCYAGAFERGLTPRAGAEMGIEQQFGGRGRAVITASSAMEYAFEGDELADAREQAPSVFTSALVEGLRTGDADRDEDGLIALDELYDYVYDKVRAVTPNQTPGKWTFGVQGELIIAHRNRPITTPAPLPRELQEAIDSPFAAVRAAAVKELVRLLQGRHAGLALAARQALKQLTEDDSRTVSAEAVAGLRAGAQETKVAGQPPSAAAAKSAVATKPAAATAKPAAVTAKSAASKPSAKAKSAQSAQVAERAPRAEVPSALVAEPVAHVVPAQVTPVAEAPVAKVAGPVPEEDVNPHAASAEVPAAASGPVESPTPAATPPGERGLTVAGGLAIVAAVMLVLGLLSAWAWPYGSYALVLAAFALAAGACVLLAGMRRRVGPGLLLGVVAASTPGLLFLPIDRLRSQTVPPGGWWFLFPAHLVLLLAGCLAWIALARIGEVRLMPLPPQGRSAWLVTIAGGAGAVALFYHDLDLWNYFSEGADRWYAFPSLLATLVALIVPTCAAVAVPRRFGVAVLAGWIGVGAALAAFNLLWDRDQIGGSASKPITTFGVTLLVLLIATIQFARAAPPSQLGPARPMENE